MPDYYNDGDSAAPPPVNTATVTINSVTYIAEDINYDTPTASVYRRDANNVAADGYHHDEPITGSATLQLASTSTALPEKYDTFTLDSITWLVLGVGKSYTLGDFTKTPITFTKRLHTPV